MRLLRPRQLCTQTLLPAEESGCSADADSAEAEQACLAAMGQPCKTPWLKRTLSHSLGLHQSEELQVGAGGA